MGALLGAAGHAAVGEGQPPPDAGALAAPSEVDIGFSQDMLVHHQQAVDMVRLLRGRGGDSVRSVAAAIENAQRGEIGMLSGWLALWGAPPVSSGPPMTWMSGHDGSTHDAMRGMAAPRDLDRFATLNGPELARHFLELMIRHHEGGLQMATYASTHARSEAVRAVAVRMLVEERQEITFMKQLLALPTKAAVTG